MRVQTVEGLAKVAGEDYVTGVGAAEGSGEAEGFWFQARMESQPSFSSR